MSKHLIFPATFSIAIVLLSLMNPAKAVLPDGPVILFMHDILDGSNPTARPVTGVLGTIYSGQLPFATPTGGFQASDGGVVIPNADGTVTTANGVDGTPLGAGLVGTSFLGTAFAGQIGSDGNSNGNNVNVQQQLAQLAPDGLGLGFGTITVIDDLLTTDPDLGTQAVGRAQGIYVASSADGNTQMMAFTAMFEGGEYGDSLNFYGIFRIGSPMSRLSITGGTGKFKGACGFAEVRSLVPTGQTVTDGSEALLRIAIYLNH